MLTSIRNWITMLALSRRQQAINCFFLGTRWPVRGRLNIQNLNFSCYLLLTVVLTCNIGCADKFEVIESEHSTSMKFDGKVLWALQHNPAKGKPYFHPLAATDGTVFTDLPKTDHPWHRGLWFSWKTINGVNYWEEKGYTGVPVEGYTRLLSTKCKVSSDLSVELIQTLEYAPSIDSEAVLKETRIVSISAPANEGSYTIDWSGEYTPLGHDIALDRTPINGQLRGKAYGGYAGLSVRLNKEMLKGAFLNSEGNELMIINEDNLGNQNGLHGRSASWMLFQKTEGGSLLIMDFPSNLNHPVKWYVDTEMPYFSPAIIFEGPKVLEVGESLKLTYRILVSPHNLDKDLADETWKRWVME